MTPLTGRRTDRRSGSLLGLDFGLGEGPADDAGGSTAHRCRCGDDGGCRSGGDVLTVARATGQLTAATAATTTTVHGALTGGSVDHGPDRDEDDDGVEKERAGYNGAHGVVDATDENVNSATQRRHSGVMSTHVSQRQRFRIYI